MGFVKIRVFAFAHPVTSQHSYIIGTIQGGLSSPIGTIPVDDDTTTFEQARSKIELFDDRGMTRRSMLFQEFLDIAGTAKNPHAWPDEAGQTYWFGRYTSDNQNIPELILASDETKPLSQFLDMKTSTIKGDLILVPQSQVGPACGKCCSGCNTCSTE